MKAIRIVAAAAALAALGAGVAHAGAAAGNPSQAELLQRIEQLEAEVKELKKDARKLEASDDTRASSKPVAGYKDGFFLATEDGRYKLNVDGYVQADSRWSVDNGDDPSVDQFSIRRARLDIRGTLADRFDFRFQPDFAGSQVVLQDAYLDGRFAPWAVTRLGKFKTPFGLEQLQADSNRVFLESSLVDNLTPNRDVGAQLYGDFQHGAFTYQLAVLNGVPDGTSGDTDFNDAVDVAARVFALPLRNTTVVPLRGLGLGVAATAGREQGTASSPQLPSFRTSSRNTYFKYSADSPSTSAATTVANGDHWRVMPQGYYYYGPFGSMFEYGVSNQELLKGATKGDTQNTAWQLRAQWLLTGEAATYDVLVPSHDFNFGHGGWGAWEVALRYAELHVDGDTFTKGFADPTKSVSQIDSITAGLNWYLNRNIKLMFDYEHSTFDKGSKTGDRDPEDVFLTRAQFWF
ncbi:MAG TPA: porin [Candidatus Binatia bacterium]|jgi:phosphate-selective porin OprO/OprP